MHNLKIALRALFRNGMYSMINVLGLAISMSAAILTLIWIQDELSFNRFHKKGDNIYLLSVEVSDGEFWSGGPAPLPIHVKAAHPEVEDYCRISYYGLGYIEYDSKKYFSPSIGAVDSSFFKIFDFKLLEGNPDKPFPDNLSMIISEKQAKLLFKDENPIGKIIQASNELSFHITGIMEDMPRNSTIRYDFLVPFSAQQLTFQGNGNWKIIDEDWGSYGYHAYFLLNPAASPEEMAEKISVTHKTARGDDQFTYSHALQPLKDTYLYLLSGKAGRIKNVKTLSIITFAILLIACINYVNLVTARTIRKRKEIGLRKILGATKANLFWQIMREMLVLFLCALLISTLIIYLVFPAYNELVGKELIFSFTNKIVLLTYLIVGLSVILLAGLYPAFMLSSFRPMDTFHSIVFKKNKNNVLRKVLVVIQFVFSAILIAVVIVMLLQMRYMRNKDMGYEKENILMVSLIKAGEHYHSIKERLMKEPGVVAVTGTDAFSVMVYQTRGDIWQDPNTQNWPVFRQMTVDTNFFNFMGIPFVEKPDFRRYSTINDSASTYPILINETAAKLMGQGDSIIGMRVHHSKEMEIIGIVKDFNIADLHEEIAPLVVFCSPDVERCIYLKTVPGAAAEAIAAVEKIWKEYNADYDFKYRFLDDSFDRIYQSDLRVTKLFSIFSVIAILISCLGLFGLVTYTAESKVKEIGIRKVLGASVGDIVIMLSREFLILVGIAMLIAFPFAYWGINRLLQDYAYRIDLSWWIFALTAIIVVLITLLTVSFQAIKAATANPVKSIKTE